VRRRRALVPSSTGFTLSKRAMVLHDAWFSKSKRAMVSFVSGEPFADPVLGLRFTRVAGFNVEDPLQVGVALDSCVDLPPSCRKFMKERRVPGQEYGVLVGTAALLGAEFAGLRTWLTDRRIRSVLILNPIGEAALTTNLGTWAANVSVMALLVLLCVAALVVWGSAC
jgi:hypothetical protein